MHSAPQLRGPKVVHAILSAALEELSEKGYAGLSVEAVAERAGVNKTTIYRRWPAKNDLVLAALAQEGDALFLDPDTGNLVEDLLIVARRVSSFLRTKHGRTLYLMVLQGGPASGNPITPEKNRREARAIVEHGLARGELPPSTDVGLVTDAFFSTLMQTALLQPEEPSDRFFRQLLRFVIAGALGTAQEEAKSRGKKR